MSSQNGAGAAIGSVSMRRQLGIGTAWIARSRLAVNLMGVVGTIVLARFAMRTSVA